MEENADDADDDNQMIQKEHKSSECIQGHTDEEERVDAHANRRQDARKHSQEESENIHEKLGTRRHTAKNDDRHHARRKVHPIRDTKV